VLAGEARFDINDYSNAGSRNAFLVRFGSLGLDPSFGPGGLTYYRPSPLASQRFDDKVRAFNVDPTTGTMFALVDQLSLNAEDFDIFSANLYRSRGFGSPTAARPGSGARRRARRR
jgi:hypothetical protein